MKLTLQLLEALEACADGKQFAINNGLIGVDIKRFTECYERYNMDDLDDDIELPFLYWAHKHLSDVSTIHTDEQGNVLSIVGYDRKCFLTQTFENSVLQSRNYHNRLTRLIGYDKYGFPIYEQYGSRDYVQETVTIHDVVVYKKVRGVVERDYVYDKETEMVTVTYYNGHNCVYNYVYGVFVGGNSTTIKYDTVYHKNGRVHKTTHSVIGTLSKTIIIYDDKGNCLYTASYDQGSLAMESRREYHDNGNIKSDDIMRLVTGRYHKINETSYIYKHENGVLVGVIVTINGDDNYFQI